jgi:hypothetical protein
LSFFVIVLNERTSTLTAVKSTKYEAFFFLVFLCYRFERNCREKYESFFFLFVIILQTILSRSAALRAFYRTLPYVDDPTVEAERADSFCRPGRKKKMAVVE